jgi:hypothetical protein
LTVNPLAKLADKLPATTGFVTVTVYAFGPSDVFGHQNFTCVLLTNT